MIPIKSIKKELADCRAAFAAHPNTPFAWCIHHEQELEPIVEPIENRIQFILKNKAKGERAIRFRNLRPARNLPTKLVKAWEAYCEADKARAKASEKSEWGRDTTWKAYVKAYAARVNAWLVYLKAYAAYKAQFSELHTRDWPDHTWTGNSIFESCE